MRILLLNQYYKPDTAATGQYLADLAEELANKGHHVHVICSRRGYNGDSTKHPTSEVLNGVYIHRVDAFGFGRRNIVGRLADYFSFYILALLKVLTIPKMDVCVALTTPPFIALVGLLLKILNGTKLILWTMDLYPQVAVASGLLKQRGLANRFLTWLSRKLYSKASCIISLGEVMTQRLIEAGADINKIKIVHNWVPAESVKPVCKTKSLLRQKWGLNGHFTLMYSGNLGIGHGLEAFVHAIRPLENVSDFRILFVGEGKAKQSLQKMVKDIGLGNVDFRSPVPLNQLSDSLAVGNIHIVCQKPGMQGLIVPSKLYGIMAAGRPVLFIGPKDCEPARIIDKSKAGIAILPGNQKVLTNAIYHLVSNPDLCVEMGKLGRAYYAQHFGNGKGVSCIIDAIEKTDCNLSHKLSSRKSHSPLLSLRG